MCSTAPGKGATDRISSGFLPTPGGGPELLRQEEGDQYPGSWEADGLRLVYTSDAGDGNRDLKLLDLRGTPESTSYLAADWSEGVGRISPDGRWMAYDSDEGGEREIYVRAFPEPGVKYKVSEGGGRSSHWSPDGRELYYWRGDTLSAATIRTDPSFEVLSRSDVLVGNYNEDYDVRPDGSGFVLLEESEPDSDEGSEEESSQLIVVVNWFEELMQLEGRGERWRAP